MSQIGQYVYVDISMILAKWTVILNKLGVRKEFNISPENFKIALYIHVHIPNVCVFTNDLKIESSPFWHFSEKADIVNMCLKKAFLLVNSSWS